MKKKYLYFAYGSNLNLEQMQRRCPDSQLVSKNEKLKGYSALFRTYLTIEENREREVIGALFEVSTFDIMALNNYEGYPQFYDIIFITTESGKKAFTYQMNTEIREIQPPSRKYLNAVIEGYENCELDIKYLDEAIDNSAKPIKISYDNIIYEGTPKAIVRQLNKDTKFPRENHRGFMNDYAYRYQIWFGEDMNFVTCLDFLKILEQKQVLKILSKAERRMYNV